MFVSDEAQPRRGGTNEKILGTKIERRRKIEQGTTQYFVQLSVDETLGVIIGQKLETLRELDTILG